MGVREIFDLLTELVRQGPGHVVAYGLGMVTLALFLLSTYWLAKRPLSVAGAKKVADDLDRMCDGLEPFKGLSLAQFAAFLAKADSYARTGVVPTTGSGTRRNPKAIDPEAVHAATEHLKSLYERVIRPEVDYTTIDAEVKKVGKQFLKDAVLEIARGFGITISLPSKKAALEEIQRRMTERKESYERTQF